MIRTILATIALSIVATPALACTVEVKRDIAYGTGKVASGSRTLVMDAYIPRDCGLKIHPIQMIHGGGFKSGSRRDPDNVRLAMDLAPRGFMVVSIDYRLSTDRPTLETIPAERAAEIVRQTGYPEAYYAMVAAEDAAKARAYVMDHAADFGLTRKRWGVIGTSAGSIVALVTAYAGDDWFGKRWHVGAVVDLWGMIPAETVDEGEPAVLSVHGTADKTVPYAYATALMKRAAEVDVSAELITLPGGAHDSGRTLIYTQSYRDGVIADRIGEFLVENVKR